MVPGDANEAHARAEDEDGDGPGWLPDPLNLDDPGLTWTRDGARVLITRVPRPTSFLKPGSALLLSVLILTGALVGDAWTLAAVFLFFTFAALVWVRLTWVTRFRMHVGDGPTTWVHAWTRARRGHLEPGAIRGARVRVTHAGGMMTFQRLVHVELLVGDTWRVLARGYRLPRGEALLNALTGVAGITNHGVKREDD